MFVFEFTCSVLLFVIDIFCGLLYPAHETLFYLSMCRKKQQYYSKLTHWTTYWIFYTMLHFLHRILYFFPFAYEIRVIAILLMAHPRIEAASIIFNFVVTNPLLLIRLIDFRNRIRDKLDKDVLPKLKAFRIVDNKSIE